MTTLERSLNVLVAAGVVTYEDAVARSLYPRDVQPRALVPTGVGA